MDTKELAVLQANWAEPKGTLDIQFGQILNKNRGGLHFKFEIIMSQQKGANITGMIIMSLNTFEEPKGMLFVKCQMNDYQVSAVLVEVVQCFL